MSVSHVTIDSNQSAFVVYEAPANLLHALVETPSGDGFYSTSVDHLGDVLGRVGSHPPVGQPLAQLSDTDLALNGQRCGLDAVDVRVFKVVVIPRCEDRRGAGW